MIARGKPMTNNLIIWYIKIEVSLISIVKIIIDIGIANKFLFVFIFIFIIFLFILIFKRLSFKYSDES